MADMASKSVLEVNGVPVRIWQWGTVGPTILFVHGYTGRGTQVAAFVEPLLAKGFKVVSFDAPAHGETPGKIGDVYKQYDVLAAVFRQFGPFHGIITHSFGGVTLGLQDKKDFADSRVVLLSIPKDCTTILDIYKRTFGVSDAVIDIFLVRLKKEYGDRVVDDLTVMNNTHKYGPNTLIVHDEDDADFPVESGETVANSIAGSTFIKTKGLGHIKVLYDDQVVNAVINFMK